MDPLDFTVTSFSQISTTKITPGPDGRFRVTALITADVMAALKALRLSRRVEPENTEAFLGDLLAGMVAPLLKNPPKKKSLETLATRAVRWALAEALTAGSPPLTRSEIQARARLSTASVALAVKWLTSLAYVTPQLGRHGTRPVEVYTLSPEGIQISSEDHPEDSTRFVLGGMLPEAPSEVQKRMEALGTCMVCDHGPGVHRFDVPDGYCDHPGCSCSGFKAAPVTLADAPQPVLDPPSEFWKSALDKVSKGSGSEDE